MDNLKEMDKFLERYNLPRLNQEEIGNMNRLITSTEIETVFKKFPTKKCPGPDGFTVNSIKHYGRANTYPSEIIPKKLQGNFQTHFLRPLSA